MSYKTHLIVAGIAGLLLSPATASSHPPGDMPWETQRGDIFPAAPIENLWTDETIITLQPGEAAEVKLVMKKGGTVQYEWAVDQGHLNWDLHTDDVAGQAHSYNQGRAKTDSSGDFTAVSDGAHGWYWRNRSDESVEVTLSISGDYSEIKRVR